MYKLLLCWRYLRTRYIAMASIISVMLGVATLIVVNSVMEGFATEMYKRLNSVLSDIVFEGPGLDGFSDPDWHEQQIREVLGKDLAGLTSTVHVPAMLNFQHRGQWVTRHVSLIGIDERSYAEIGDFSEYLMHPENRKKLSFALRHGGYDERIPPSGWDHRRVRVEYERAYQEQVRAAANRAASPVSLPASESAPSPATVPESQLTNEAGAVAATNTPADPFQGNSSDPFHRGGKAEESQVFDESKEQHTGLVMGLAIAGMRHHDPLTGKAKEYFLCRPGDDVMLTFPNAAALNGGEQPKAITEKCTIVDLYESKMSEYDSSFVFMPLKVLQKARGMIDPLSGVTSVTSIQIKLKAGANLEACQQRLFERFPQERYMYRIRTWKELQGPLLQAVQMETTILNILLFMIIAVAGFGILATFFMIVVEKTRDVGILKALGAPSRGVMSIFLSYGVSLGLVGSGVGTILGLWFVIKINDIAAALERITGREVFDPTIYYFQTIPTLIDPLTIAWICAGSVLIAVLASVLPALRAARLHPVEALRYE